MEALDVTALFSVLFSWTPAEVDTHASSVSVLPEDSNLFPARCHNKHGTVLERARVTGNTKSAHLRAYERLTGLVRIFHGMYDRGDMGTDC